MSKRDGEDSLCELSIASLSGDTYRAERFGILLLLLLYCIVGIPKIDPQLIKDVAPHRINSIFSTVGFVFVSYGGLLKVASVAEEVRNLGRTLPLGLMMALICVTVFYARP